MRSREKLVYAKPGGRGHSIYRFGEDATCVDYDEYDYNCNAPDGALGPIGCQNAPLDDPDSCLRVPQPQVGCHLPYAPM